MISYTDQTFHLQTKNSSYVFQITPFGHLEHLHYGDPVRTGSFSSLQMKRTVPYGSSILYDAGDPTYSLDGMPLEWSGSGRGDYRPIPLELRMPDATFVTDFIYKRHVCAAGTVDLSEDVLPQAHGRAKDCQTLRLFLKDTTHAVTLELIYTVFYDCDVISRRAVLRNDSAKSIEIRKFMSLMLDVPDRQFNLTTLHGAWIREAQRQQMPLPYGVFSQESTTGTSSHRHNPAFFLAEQDAGECHGRVYGFNLLYSGNHRSEIAKSEQGLVRVMTGISPHAFSWTLAPGDSFIAPEAVMAFCPAGIGGMSRSFHRFIHNHIIPPYWQKKERPILINSWEAFGFDFTARKLMGLAKRAKDLGIELFVLDDGWFGQRHDDTAGLGDYTENQKKLPHGLSSLATRIKKIGLDFGLWVEPEMISPDSDLYRAHPEYAVSIPGRKPVMGRNQLVLDLCNPKVRDRIVSELSTLFDRLPLSYVKWDMNRHISDCFSPLLQNQGEFSHRYVLGLYEILRRIFGERPDILLESCASGGNRFDLGMLCFSPQIWASDNTDPIERLRIQGGLSLFYPPSTWGAHVAAAPHQQSLRQTPLTTRFYAACLGCLGYELDLNHLSRAQRQEVSDQIAFYKMHRHLFQFGSFYRLQTDKPQQVHWQVLSPDRSEAIAFLFQNQIEAADRFDRLTPQGLDPNRSYRVVSKETKLSLKRFGGLVNHISPLRMNPEGMLFRLADRFYRLPGCRETYEGSGRQLMTGIMLENAFLGTGYHEQIRLLGDFDSTLYIITAVKAEKEEPHG